MQVLQSLQGLGASRAGQQLLQVLQRLCGHKAGDRGRLATTPHQISKFFRRAVNSAVEVTFKPSANLDGVTRY